jgi:hypothetical protein
MGKNSFEILYPITHKIKFCITKFNFMNIKYYVLKHFYNSKTNGYTEEYFNQIKHYLKLNKKILKYDELKEEVKREIKNVKKENYKNYHKAH